LALEDGVQRVRVVARGIPVDGGVRAHHRGRAALVDGRVERREVDLLLDPRVDDRVVGGGVAVRLLVVDRVVLDHGHDVLALHALDVSGAHLAGQVGILAHRLEGPAPARVAHHVDRGPEVDVDALAGVFRADDLAVLLFQAGIPGGGGRDRGGWLGDAGHAVTYPGRAVLEGER